MGKFPITHRGGHFLTRVLFSLLTPAFLMPGLARLRITGSCVLFCFGKLSRSRYQSIIDSFQEKYASAISRALSKVQELSGQTISVVVDCGTGTGFATQKALEFYPQAGFMVLDRLETMLGGQDCPVAGAAAK